MYADAMRDAGMHFIQFVHESIRRIYRDFRAATIRKTHVRRAGIKLCTSYVVIHDATN